jgi:hypothetical protein
MLNQKAILQWLKDYGFECEIEEEVEKYVKEYERSGEFMIFESFDELKEDLLLYVKIDREM